MENNSLVLKGLTGSVILIGATLVALPGAAADSDTEIYGVTQSDLSGDDLTSSFSESTQNQIGVAAPAQSIAAKPKKKEKDLEVLDLQTEEEHEVEVTESVEIEDYTVDFTDSDGEEAAYITVRREGEIIHDNAHTEEDEVTVKDLNIQVESIDHEEESLKMKTSVKNGYVLHGGPSVNELVDKLEKVNPRLDTTPLKDSEHNALIVTGDNTEQAVKNLASLQEGVKKSEIDIETI